MTWIARLFRRRRIYDDVAEEIRSHLQERTDALIARGMSRADAEADARRAFGNVTSINERANEAWQWPVVESILLDVRYALRQLRRAPALSAIIILTLAVGIGGTATVFSWARTVLLDAMPGARDPARLMALETTTASGSWTAVSWLDYRDFQRYLRTVDGLVAAYPTSLAVGDETHAERRWGELVSANFFSVLGVRPALGRFFTDSVDDVEGSRPAIVIGYGLWQSRWHGDSAIIGSVVHVNRYPFTVIGVAAPEFRGSMLGQDFQLWVPASMLGQIVPTGSWWLRDRGTRTFRALARLAPGSGIDAARDDAEALATRMSAANAENRNMHARVMPLWQSHWGVQDELRAPLSVLFAACGLVLLIVCANTANLLLARATGRSRELALRVALGAPRRRLARQLLTEAVLLAVIGSAMGLLCATWLAQSLRWLFPSYALPVLLAPRVDAVVLAFTALLTCGVVLLAGVAPALHGSRRALSDVLNAGGRAHIGGLKVTRVRGMLVAAEMALALTSLIGAGMFYRSFRNTRALTPGFSPDHVAMASVSVTLSGYDSARAEAFLADAAERMRRQPGTEAVSYTDYVPLSLGLGSWEDLRVEGYAPPPNENMKLYRAAIGPDYFSALRIPLVEGRDFTLADDSAHAAVMIVNQAFARRYLANRGTLGVRVHGWGRWFTIVGVAADAKNYRVTEPPTPYFYVPVRQVFRPENGYTFLVRSGLPPDRAAQGILTAVAAADPTVPVFDAMPLAEYVAGPLRLQRTALQLMGLTSVLALFLAAIALYGVIAYSVAQRTQEIGVRVALGAGPGDVLRTVAAQAGALLVFGLGAGLAGGAVAARLVSAMLYDVRPVDAGVFAAAAAGLVAIAALATAIPAQRALRVDPAVALRAE